ncbi:MAG TPA: nucleotidyltransferase family protein [Steroidobacteraceae bacterium]|nr:nucleotidyltransferase family protein [Steroidobacteraceae bacterium]
MNTAEMQIIVLAASASTRSGPPKKTAPDQAMLSLPLVLSRATAVAGHAVSVVLGAHAAEIAPALGRLPVSLVVNREWNEGIASSIRAGLISLPGSCAAALLVLADQSAVTSADLQRLADTWRRSPRAIVAAQYSGGYGVPAVFPRAEFPALLRLRGEQGAEVLLRNPAIALIGVPMPSAATDLDRPGGTPGVTES